MQHTKRLITLALAMLLAASLFLLPACDQPEPPALELQSLVWPVSVPLPTAEDFIVAIPEGYTVSLAEKYNFSALGTYPVSLILTDERGREFTYSASLTLVSDTIPPTIAGVQEPIITYLGSGASYRSGVSVSDNCSTKIELEIDSSAVNLKAVGEYKVIYRATDAAGNVTEIHRTVAVYEEEITAEKLNALIDPILAKIIKDGMGIKEKLRAVYDYVYENVSYSSTSDKNSWMRAAYSGILEGRGDCFTYFALSKAMMERLGIENLDIERTPEIAAMVNERHYWSLVNIGTKEAPMWYHFDSCRLNNVARPWGFLMTDSQLILYSDKRENADGISGYFYAYDTTAYPPSAEQIITQVYP